MSQRKKLIEPIRESRFFRTSDPVIETYELKSKKKSLSDNKENSSQTEDYTWNFRLQHWWSRLYEYRWMLDAAKNYYKGSDLSKIKVLDAACGDLHPSCFMLADLGFGQIVAQDLFDSHPLIERFPLKNLTYLQGNLLAKFPDNEFDCINFISTLEHIEPLNQPVALQNLCNRLKPGGLIIMTFDIPGFEYVTNLDDYKNILRDNFIVFQEDTIDEKDLLSSLNSVGAVTEGWELTHKKINKLFCYRLLGVKQM